MEGDHTRTVGLRAFEQEAEALLAYQLDLLAHLEAQLRATHEMIRGIETLRTAKERVGPELSNGQRGDVLAHVNVGLSSLDSQLRIQRELCADMHRTVDAMESKLNRLRQAVEPRQDSAE